MRIIIYIFLVLTFVSCRLRSSMIESTKQSHETSDSTYFSKTVQVDTVSFPTENLRFTVRKEVFKRDTVIVYKNGRASTKIIYRNGKFDVNTQCDSLSELVLSYKEKLFQSMTENDALIKSSEEVIVKEVRWYYRYALWFSLASALYIFISLFLRFFSITKR